MRRINTAYLSNDECWSVQINGWSFCQNCKWTGISPCKGKNIVKTHRNSKGYKIEEFRMNTDDYDQAFDKSKNPEKPTHI